MELYSLMEDYLRALRYEHGAAATTHKQYQSQLRHFHRWLTENGYPTPTLNDFTTPVLRRFLYYLAGKGLRPRTLRSYFYPLTGLGAFLIANGVLTENPAKSLTMPKLDAAKRLTVSDAEINLLLQACERERNPRKVAFHRAVLSVLIYSGLRRAEVCNLYLDDLSLKEKSLLVRSGKGSKSRKVYLCDEAMNALKEWVAFRAKSCKHPYLFAYDVNRRLHFKGIAALLEELKARAGLADRDAIKPHSLRHAAATRLLRNGANLRDIQAFLGHTQLNTTSIYLHSSEEQLRDIAHLASLQTPDKPQEADNIIRLPQGERERKRLRRIAR